ncbi:hypothetical protein GGH94_005674 [Coemansia aciculifera]|uniref:Myb-like domain-containing protein n=1 Tax=Coemansia aciculifera TaxID=417176 RepID=A0A9W8M424_9FUNG|nr:hypothetical protein GGH94_005674 [Coemansia aciculifera]
MDAWEAYSGEALKILSVPPYDGVTFPRVGKLSVVLHYSRRREGFNGGNDGFPDDTLYNVREFVGRVAEMAPAIGEVYIDMRDETTDRDPKGVYYFEVLFSGLFEIGEMKVLNDPSGEMSPHIRLDYIEDLVRLTSYVDYLNVQILQLTRRSAQTLQCLDIRSYRGSDITGLITDPDGGEYAEYPRLHTLEMRLNQKHKAFRRMVFNGAMPFPSLQRLCIESLYPFDDDVFFRGNAATLEYLTLSLCKGAVAILAKHNVFTPTSHPRLQYVNIARLSQYASNKFTSAAAYLEFVMNIAPGASVRQITNERSYSEDITPALSVFGNYASIQVLSLAYTELSLWGIISLIKSLPLLSDLTTRTPSLGELPLGMSTSDLPEYVRTNYAPMGKRFRCWHTLYCYKDDVAEIATVVLLLALACPNFDYASVDDYSTMKPLMEAMEEKIAKPEFNQDALPFKRKFIAAGHLLRFVSEGNLPIELVVARVEVVPPDGTFKSLINEIGYRRIYELRDSGLNWKDIHQHFLQYPNITQLRRRFVWFKTKLEDKTGVRLFAEWTDAERERVKDLIKQHMESTSRLELIDIIQHALPARPLSDIRLFSNQYVHELKAGRMRVDQINRLRELVAEYGEDWSSIGEALGMLPSRAQHNWIEYGGDVAITLLGPTRQQDDTLSGSLWAASDDETLLKMIDRSTMAAAAKWELVSKVLGRSMYACKVRFTIINGDSNRKQAMDGRESSVTGEVQRQRESSSAADWSQVSQVTGLGLRECLELSQYDGGKASWHYNPDSFSQSMADRMTGFIEEHYPAPAPVNYRAVSNFMWAAMEDCIHIHDMLQGKFKWTEADYERAAALRAQGLTYKEVARHLAPTLRWTSTANALKRYLSARPAQEPISVDELEEIS